jgi:uncharacterized protein (DUF58 family)
MGPFEKIPVPTTRAALLAAMGIPLALLWGWTGFFALNMLLLCLGIADTFLSSAPGQLRAERHCPDRLAQGVAHRIEIKLQNRGSRARWIAVRDQTPLAWPAPPVLKGILPARGGRAFAYQVVPQERGTYDFGDLFLRLSGPLGLILRPVRVPASQQIKVHPHLQTIRYTDLAAYRRRATHWGLRPAAWRGEGREFEALREYVEGDDTRKIHWKATARLDRPIVQEYRPEKNQIVLILLDAGRLMGAVSQGKTKLDHALEAAVHLGHTALAGGDQTGILAFADRVLSFVPPGGGPAQLQAIMEGTLDLRPTRVEPQYEAAFLWLRTRVRRRALIVLFTDLLDDVVSENLLSALALLRPRHLPLCVAVREAELNDLLDRPPNRAQEVYERVVLQEVLRQRRKGLMRLVGRGALAMDLPPEALSMGTIERYLEIKRKGLL